MSEKKKDDKNRWRNKTIAFRGSPEEAAELDKRWKLCGYATKQDYLIDSMLHLMDEAEAYMQLIRENIEYDAMMSSKTWRDRDAYEELYQLICDVVCVPRKTIRIGGEDYPYNLVKSKFLKLTSSHLEYVISCMNNNTTKISNIRAYLITALYNAPNTINSYYQAEVNYDMYGAWRDGE